MAQIGFGLNVNKTAQESGYDQYAVGFGDVLKATAEETWARNPLSSTSTLIELQRAALKENSPLVSKDQLNAEYGDLGLSFEEDEYQSVVDLMVEEKQAERERQSIIARGPQGFGVGAAKFAVGLGVSMLDPINVASAFIPVVGQARMAQMVAKTGFTRARLAKGVKEGAVGAALVEPVVALAASELQADYGLADSFLNITFGSLLGGGLHVGVGKLSDLSIRTEFRAKVRRARENLGIDSPNIRDAEINLYKAYYPENSEIMRDLATTDPQTRKVLLEKSLNDLMLEKQVDVAPIVDADPVLKQSSDTSAKPNNRVQPETPRSEQQQSTAVNNTVNKTESDFDVEIENLNQRLQEKRQARPELRFDEDAKDIDTATQALDEAQTKSDDIKAAVKDLANCIDGR
jgi:hypothetical protein